MRNPNRLYEFYDKLRAIHMTQFPDMRFGQLMYNLWAGSMYDLFYCRNDYTIFHFSRFNLC